MEKLSFISKLSENERDLLQHYSAFVLLLAFGLSEEDKKTIEKIESSLEIGKRYKISVEAC